MRRATASAASAAAPRLLGRLVATGHAGVLVELPCGATNGAFRCFGSTAVPPPLGRHPSAGVPAHNAAREGPPATVDGDAEGLTPYCLDLRGLIATLRQELPAKPARGAKIDEAVVERVSEVLRQTKLNPREWRQHAVFRRGRYTRNIVGYSPGQFVALLLCWERGQQSPIHDHSGAHCFVRMLQGRLKEESFDWASDGPGANPKVTSEVIMDATKPAQSVAFAHDTLGLHRVSNPDNEEVAVSLHIYSPPFEDCLVFPPTGAAPKRAPMVSINAPSLGSISSISEASFRPSGLTPPPSLRDLSASLSRIGAELAPPPPAPSVAAAPGVQASIDPSIILDLLGNVEMSPFEWASLASPAHFSDFHCSQNLIYCDDHFSVMVSCWSPGQSVPPHHIGKGRQEWVKVVHGSLEFQELASGLFWGEVERSNNMPEGSISHLGGECSARMRSLANASETSSAISVHVFSPPLTQFTFRTEKGSRRQDVPMLHGALSMDVSSGPPTSAPSPFDAAAAAGAAASAETSVRGLMRTAGQRYLSFRALTKLLDEELARQDCSDDAVTALLRKAVFNAEEWRSHLTKASINGGAAGPQSVVLAQRPEYTLMLSFWGHHAQQLFTARCRGFGRTWTLILEGELEERAFAVLEEASPGHRVNGSATPNGLGPMHVNGGSSCNERRRRLQRVSTLKQESVSFLNGKDEVQLCCDSDVPCVSLHLFSPALAEHGPLTSLSNLPA